MSTATPEPIMENIPEGDVETYSANFESCWKWDAAQSAEGRCGNTLFNEGSQKTALVPKDV